MRTYTVLTKDVDGKAVPGLKVDESKEGYLDSTEVLEESVTFWADELNADIAQREAIIVKLQEKMARYQEGLAKAQKKKADLTAKYKEAKNAGGVLTVA